MHLDLCILLTASKNSALLELIFGLVEAWAEPYPFFFGGGDQMFTLISYLDTLWLWAVVEVRVPIPGIFNCKSWLKLFSPIQPRISWGSFPPWVLTVPIVRFSQRCDILSLSLISGYVRIPNSLFGYGCGNICLLWSWQTEVHVPWLTNTFWIRYNGSRKMISLPQMGPWCPSRSS